MDLPKRIGKKFWMSEIDEFMKSMDQPTMTWEEVIKAEGGYGKDFSNPDLELDLDSYPGRWFASAQTDFDLYGEYPYIYSLLFGALHISGQVYVDFTRRNKALPINDVGGSIFTAMLMLRNGAKYVNISNVSDSPQLYFAKWFVARYGVPVNVGREEPGVPTIMSEYLEHFYEPCEELARVTRIVGPGVEMGLSSSFCMPAYGHFIPIYINGADHTTPRSANKAFLEHIEHVREWPLARIGLFNKGYLVVETKI